MQNRRAPAACARLAAATSPDVGRSLYREMSAVDTADWEQ
jgi:hypothetical protein